MLTTVSFPDEPSSHFDWVCAERINGQVFLSLKEEDLVALNVPTFGLRRQLLFLIKGSAPSHSSVEHPLELAHIRASNKAMRETVKVRHFPSPSPLLQFCLLTCVRVVCVCGVVMAFSGSTLVVWYGMVRGLGGGICGRGAGAGAGVGVGVGVGAGMGVGAGAGMAWAWCVVHWYCVCVQDFVPALQARVRDGAPPCEREFEMRVAQQKKRAFDAAQAKARPNKKATPSQPSLFILECKKKGAGKVWLTHLYVSCLLSLMVVRTLTTFVCM
jgi:hypothetical protein